MLKRLRFLLYALLAVVGGVIALAFSAGCRALFPKRVSGPERLAAFPTSGLALENPVRIYWNSYQVPFIEAQSDSDLAYSLGLVHAHLRGAQMAFFKRISQGRASEMAGPIALPLDQALRTLDFGYAANAMLRSMDPATRQYLERYVEGLNDYQLLNRSSPPETGLMGLKPEPFTVEDILTFGRLAGTDVNWLAYAGLLDARNDPNWELVWQRALKQGAANPPSIQDNLAYESLASILSGFSRSGSNSLVVGPSLSADGHAIIANDPHLGTFIPNFWLLVGIKSPTLHGVGAMIPGLPFLAYGRTPNLAWGGTNMRSASSDLYDISGLDPAEQAIETRSEEVKVRLWPDQTIELRRSAYGPILSDLDFFPGRPGEVVALRWVGHDVSNEIRAFLSANRARSIPEFVASFRDYAVSGQNLLLADNDGNIAMMLATRLPIRSFQKPPDLILDASDPEYQWKGYLNASELPLAYNPPEGYIASANNKPARFDPPIGFLFGEPERINRIREIMTGAQDVDFEFLRHLQMDVQSPAARRLQSAWRELLRRNQIAIESMPVLRALESWDGNYQSESPGAVAFELFTYHVVENLPEGFPDSFSFRNWPYYTQHLVEDLATLEQSDLRSLLQTAASAAQADFEKYPTWGDLHYQQAAHFLRNIPVIGPRFEYARFPANGSRETLYKTAHETSNEPVGTNYGSQARHISFMRDLDENYFVLFGGQDGWLGSEHFVDQVPLWEQGEYIRLPLRMETVQREFHVVLDLNP